MPASKPRRVCIESPLRGDYERNVMYADACMLDSLMRGEAPFLGHLLYPRVLDDSFDAHRALGIAAHLAWLEGSHLVALYVDYGVTEGMTKARELARRLEIPHEVRMLGPNWLPLFMARVRSTPGLAS